MHYMEKIKQLGVALIAFAMLLVLTPFTARAQTSGISCNAATLNGYVSPGGSSVTVWFEYGTNQGSVSSGSGTKTAQQTFSAAATFSQALTSLSPSTIYYYRAMARSSLGTTAGATLSFQTPSCSTPPSGQMPTAYTNAASSISQSDAQLNGYVDPRGSSDTVRWFEYGSNQNNLSNSTGQQSIQSAGNVSSYISNLSSNTTYYFRVGARNAQGSTYGSVMSFTTNSGGNNGGLPSASTRSASSVTSSSAQLNGYVDTNGTSDTSRWFEYGTSQGNLSQQTSRISIGYAGAASAYVSNLQSNTTYYFRVAAQNSYGTVYGSVMSFSTNNGGNNGGLPSATTRSVTSYDQQSATLDGYVDPNGTSDTVRWFEWGTTSWNLGQSTNRVNIGYAGEATAYISGLSSNTNYYYRVAAQNGSGTVYGSTLSFTTQNGSGCTNCGSQPTATTNAATSIGQNDAQLNGYVSSNGNGNVTRWFEWGTNSSNFQNASTRVDVGSGGSTQTYISNLQPNTTYYFRVNASNSYGTVNGQVLSFTTNGGSGCTNCNNGYLTATTNSASSVDSDSAQLNGYVSMNGSVDSSVTRWFEYGTNSNNLSYQTSRLSIGYSGNASAYVSNLSSNTTYYFRIAAQSNNSGTVYGQVMTFYTSGGGGCYNCNNGSAPIVNTRSADSVDSSSANLNGYVDANGSGNTSSWFEWGRNYDLGNSTSRHYQGSSANSIAAQITGLSPNTTYYYRAVASNDYGTTRGQTMNFTTNGGGVITDNGQAPQAITTLATNVTGSGATLNSLIVSNGGDAVTAWFEWGTNAALGRTTEQSNVGSAPSVRHAASIYGLQYGQTYYFRIVAQNSHGRNYGVVRSFVARNTVIATPTTHKSTRRATTVRHVVTQVVQQVVHANGADSLVMLTITGGNDSLAKGEQRTYHVTWRNVSDQNLSNVVLRILVPQSMNFESSDYGTFSKVDSTLTYELGSLQTGQQGEMNFVLNAGDTLKPGDLVVTTANLVYTDENAVQGDALAYVTQRVTENGQVLGASVGFAGFPVVLLGWLLLIILIIVLLILCHHLYKQMTGCKKEQA